MSKTPSVRVRTRFDRLRAFLIAIVSAVVCLVAPIASSTPAFAYSGEAILFVHGFGPAGDANCMGSGWSADGSSEGFGSMIPQMRNDGFYGTLATVGYYSGDWNCSANLHDYGSYNDGDDFINIARAFSWYVYDTYTQQGTPVDVVGYSMGGLITRAAIYGASIGASGFSPPIYVSDVVTLGTPHQGAAWYSGACTIIGWTQCSAMVPGSPQLNWLNQNGDPQGAGPGTYWTNIGSYDDDVVPWQSATSMSISQDHKLVYSEVSHTGWTWPDYMDASNVVSQVESELG